MSEMSGLCVRHWRIISPPDEISVAVPVTLPDTRPNPKHPCNLE